MKLKGLFAGFLVCVFVAGMVYAGMEKVSDPISILLEGNKRCVEGEQAKKDIGETRRAELTKGQHPFAVVISCSDSRVPPELIFDQGLGDIFVVRVAGNVIDPVVLGSIEYGVEHLHSPLLLVLGHESCGAVKATLDLKGKPEGNIGAILKKIVPAVKTAKRETKDESELLHNAIHENIRNSYKDVMKSKIVNHLVKEGKLKVVAAEYYLGTGKVEVLADIGAPEMPKLGHQH
jgi:carbonic anhydrase